MTLAELGGCSLSLDSSSDSTRSSQTVAWRIVGQALIVAIVGTAVPSIVILTLHMSVWWIVLASAFSLFAGGAYLGWRSREPEPVYGTLLAILYFGLVVGILFGGELAEALPDPLPGLGIGDSTFFFVWPLIQLAAAVGGSVAGGRMEAQSRPK